jgi:uncharacterized membrane protein HdeD (DUF308 family)
MAEELAAQVASGLKRAWWLSMVRGIVMVVLGFVLMVWPGMSLTVAFVVLGLFAAIDGLVTAVIGLVNLREPGGSWFVVEGLIGLALGVVVLAWPGRTIAVLFYLLAIWTLVVGIVATLTAVRLNRAGDPGWYWTLSFGLVLSLLGLILLIRPGARDVTVNIFGVVLGMVAFAGGVLQIVGGMQTRTLVRQFHKPSATV